jgi:DNA modification methylase
MTTMREYGVGLFKAEFGDGKFQSNIIEGISREVDDRYRLHCTPKPVALMEYLVELLVPEGDAQVVLDPFAGSGTTLAAAESLGRSWVGIEIVDAYCSLIERRIADLGDTLSVAVGSAGVVKEQELSALFA